MISHLNITQMKRIIAVLIFFNLWGCTPEFLDKKPSKDLVVPHKLFHYRAILDAYPNGMNTMPVLQVVAGDEFFHLEDNVYNLNAVERNAYLWNEDIFEGKASNEWDLPYRCVFYSNIVLDGLIKLDKQEHQSAEWKEVYGGALFYRSYAFFHLAQLFAPAYNKAGSGHLPGIPVRLTSDINEIAQRGNLQHTYDQIVGDLLKAVELLPNTSSYNSRPSRSATFAMLARVYLVMQEYRSALEAADQSLKIYDRLLDYNTLNPQATRPFPVGLSGLNPEIIYYSQMNSYSILNSTYTGVNPELYKSYHDNDLRKTCFFNARNGLNGFKGSYLSGNTLFGGLTTAEMLLIRAECNARLGNNRQAVDDLNTLLEKRYVKGTFVKLEAGEENLLEKVLQERRKELFGRGLRWSDLRRLNQEPGLETTLTRTVNGKKFELRPGSNRYVFPIPDNEISVSGIEQNPRSE